MFRGDRLWTLGKGEAPYGYLGPLLERGAKASARLDCVRADWGKLFRSRALLTFLCRCVVKGKKIGDSLQRCRKRKTIRTWTQPALSTQNSKAFLEDRDPEGAVAGWDWASTSCSGGVLGTRAPRQACTVPQFLGIPNAQSQRERSAGRGAALHKRHNVTQLGLTSRPCSCVQDDPCFCVWPLASLFPCFFSSR